MLFATVLIREPCVIYKAKFFLRNILTLYKNGDFNSLVSKVPEHCHLETVNRTSGSSEWFLQLGEGNGHNKASRMFLQRGCVLLSPFPLPCRVSSPALLCPGTRAMPYSMLLSPSTPGVSERSSGNRVPGGELSSRSKGKEWHPSSSRRQEGGKHRGLSLVCRAPVVPENTPFSLQLPQVPSTEVHSLPILFICCFHIFLMKLSNEFASIWHPGGTQDPQSSRTGTGQEQNAAAGVLLVSLAELRFLRFDSVL